MLHPDATPDVIHGPEDEVAVGTPKLPEFDPEKLAEFVAYGLAITLALLCALMSAVR